MLTERQGIVVWLYNLKHAKTLRRFGHVHYVSKKLKYVVIYCDRESVESVMDKLSHYSYVKKVEPSFKPYINTEYENSKPDKAKEYDYKIGL
ncbi:YlbG family protein [Bacillus sp. 2205SS5-2]|uniref:YlbG family protein n=1 Tax=Bacillus sp. 2205SS5-2 TaxID=3109031 RepID=UPI0030041DA0